MALSERNIGDLQELYAKVHRKIEDGRPEEAVEVCEQIMTIAERLGEELTLTHHPICEPCAGSAEIGSPSESDRKVRCQDMAYRTGKPGECQGNRYGRMSPTQLQEYVAVLLAKTAAPIHDSEGPTPEPEPKPTLAPVFIPPKPPYVYSRDAVIAFNQIRRDDLGDNALLIPIPEDDEEVLANMDGTFTVRKKEPAANMGL